MGGTSCDVSLIDGIPTVTTEAVVGGCPIHIPVLDIHTIGAGGGSIGYADPGGALRVGPESAGADPGPACYGRGSREESRPTVTDANLFLGRLAPDYFLGGLMSLDLARTQYALARLGDLLGLDPVQASLGIIEIVNTHMERALRVISVERGYDPVDFTLLSFGGAGGLHAADLARRLGIRRVLVPPLASTLSAFGMLAADVVKDYSHTIMASWIPSDGAAPLEKISQTFASLTKRAIQDIQAEGIGLEDIRVERLLDMRYQGQSYELSIPWHESEETLQQAFHTIHQRSYGYYRPEAALEIVNVRLRAVGKIQPPGLLARPFGEPDPSHALLEQRPVIGQDGISSILPFYRGEALLTGNTVHGPAVVVRSDTTILLGPTDQAAVDPYENLMITIGTPVDG
jgi:N-methylhydantoinase A